MNENYVEIVAIQHWEVNTCSGQAFWAKAD